MNTIITFVKSLRLARILVIFLAGMVLLFSTACSNLPKAVSDLTNGETQTPSIYKQNENVSNMMKESYKTVPPQGGMNQHQDVDRRQNTSAAQAKAKGLVDNAQKNVKQGVRDSNKVIDDVKDNLSADKVKDTFENIKDNVSQSAQDFKQGTQRGLKNIKNNLDSTVDQVSDNIQQAVQ